ncbi:DUF3397 domain-containing protein [Massilibacterium senegalense]|uniref:DUF3397 domain-containing protein n=1 Tax=Massilibacterium senegalense TaxID=1632858 RepID=UPI0007836D2C|nr:DUF3397 domain-containing protein [Massilibacterium senegalense]
MISIAVLFIIWSALPPVLGLTVYVFFKYIPRTQHRAFHIAVDITTIFLIFAVYFLMIQLFQFSGFSYIVLIILLVGLVMTIIHYKKFEYIRFKKLIKSTWRFCFLIFFLGFIGLVTYGIFTLVN